MVLMQAGATDKAVALMEQSPAGAQTAPSSNLFMAMVYRKHGQLDKAEGIVKGLLEKPDLATVQFAAGLYLELGRRADAEKALALLDNIKLEPALKEMIWGAYYLQTNKPAEAIAQYQAAVKQAPANAVTWRTLSAVYMLLGAKNEAMEAIREGAKTVPTDKGLQAESRQVDLLREALDDPGLAGVVLLYHRNPLAGDAPLELMRLVTDARRANDMQRLAARLQQFIERHTDFMPAYIRLAQCFSEMGRANDALTAAQHAMNVFPSDPEPARIATQVAAVSQKWSDMRSAAEAWKKRSNNDPNADVALARALTGLGQYEAARNQLRAYVAAAQANPEQYAAMLSIYAGATVNLGNEQEAMDMLWPLAQRDSRWRGLWVDTSLLFKDAKETIAWLDKVEAAIPADAPAERMGIAEALDILGRREKNSQLLQRATQLSIQIADQASENLVAQLTAAAQAERMGDSKLAEVYYRRSLAIDPTNWIANNNLAMIILRAGGNTNDAVAYATTAVKSHPRSPNIYDTLAFAQAKSGDAKAASKTIRVALDLSPDNMAYQVRLALYLLDSGQQNEAITKIREIDSSGRLLTLDDESQKIFKDIRKRANI
jgi:tetratricopeptide (TPR) repeat protein